MTIQDIVSIISTPGCWIQNYAYSPSWDAECRRLMAEGIRLVDIDGYRAEWGPYCVWTENHPYASFVLCDRHGVVPPNDLPKRRPSRAVILRAGAMIKAARKNTELDIEAYIAGKQGSKSSSRAVERAAGNL